MKRKTDIPAIEAALKKAARDALAGARELRAGRFIGRDAESGKFATRKNMPARKPRSKV